MCAIYSVCIVYTLVYLKYSVNIVRVRLCMCARVCVSLCKCACIDTINIVFCLLWSLFEKRFI